MRVPVHHLLCHIPRSGHIRSSGARAVLCTRGRAWERGALWGHGGHGENGIGGYPVGGGTFWAELSLLGEGQPEPRVTEHSPEDSREG